MPNIVHEHFVKAGEIVEYISLSVDGGIYDAEVIQSRGQHIDISVIISQSKRLKLSRVPLVPRDKRQRGTCSVKGPNGKI